MLSRVAARHGDTRVSAEVVQSDTVRGDGGANAVLLLLVHRDLGHRGLEPVAAQGMRPGSDRGTGLAELVAVPHGEAVAAHRGRHKRVEAYHPGADVAHVHHVRGAVERQPRAPAPAAHVRAGVRANIVRRAQHTVLRALARVARRHRYHTSTHVRGHGHVPLFPDRRVRVPVRRDGREQPHHAAGLRVRHPAAVRRLRLPVVRLLERQARLRRRVRTEHRSQRARPVPGHLVHLRLVRAVQTAVRLALQDDVQPGHRRQKLQDHIHQT